MCFSFWLLVSWACPAKYLGAISTIRQHYFQSVVRQQAITWIKVDSAFPGANPSSSMLVRLTHWGRMTHICLNELNTIGSDNGLSPSRHQAIIWTNAGILLIGTNCSEILSEIHTFSFKKMHVKMSSGKWPPFCLGLNVLTTHQQVVSSNPVRYNYTHVCIERVFHPDYRDPRIDVDWYRSDAKMLDRYLIDVNPRVFAIRTVFWCDCIRSSLIVFGTQEALTDHFISFF